MQSSYGAFEVISELHRGPRATLFSARAEGTTDECFAAKIVAPNVNIIGREQADRRCAAYLDSVRAQQAITDRGAKHWVTVHDLGQKESSAYAIFDRYARSLEEVIAFRTDIDASGLHRFISGVIAGLRELADAGNGRAHGNLKSTNVLIDDSGLRVALTDPLSDEQIAQQNVTVADDLREVGKLIYALVRHEHWRGGYGAKVETHPAWNKLGRTGERWHQLCSQILEEGTGQTSLASLEELADVVATLTPADQQGSNRKYLVGGVAGTLAVVILSAIVFWPSAQPGETTDADAGQAQLPMNGRDEPLPPTPPQVSAWQSAMAWESGAKLIVVTGQDEFGDLRGEEAERAIDQMTDALVRWIEHPGRVLEQRGWGIAAAELPNAQVILDHMNQGREADFNESVRHVSQLHEFVERLEQHWQEFLRLKQQADGTLNDDEILQRFWDVVDAELKRATSRSILEDRLVRAKELAKRLPEGYGHYTEAVDHQHFRSDSGLFERDALSLRDFETWLAFVYDDRFALLDESADPRRNVAANQLGGVNARLNTFFRECDDAEGAIQAEYDRVVQLDRQFWDMPWDGTRETRRAIEDALSEMIVHRNALHARLGTRIEACRGAECQQQLAEMMSRPFETVEHSASLAVRWEQAVEAVDIDGDCLDQLSVLEDARDELNRIHQSFPLADEFDERARAIILSQREQAVERAIVEDANRDDLARQYRQWRERAGAMLDEFAQIEQSIALAKPFETFRSGFEQWYGQPEFVAQFEELVHDTQSVAGSMREVVEQSDREWLLEVIQRDEEHIAVRVEAWRRLGTDLQHPDTLQHEVLAWETIEPALVEIVDDSRRLELLQTMSERRTQRWTTFVERIGTRHSLEEALDLREQFDVIDQRLPDWLQYNIALRGFLELVAEVEPADIYVSAATFASKANRFAGQLGADEGALARLQQELQAIAETRDQTGPDLSTVGLGVAGWAGDVDDIDGVQVLRFTPPEHVQDQPPMIFRRISDNEPVFLATTEVTIGILQTVFSETDRHTRRALLEANRFSGARGWEATEDWSELHIRNRWLGGLASASRANYCVGDDDPPPGSQHPAHQITVAAAMYVADRLGCRLPTFAEWTSALDSVENDPKDDANLRGEEWVERLLGQTTMLGAADERHWWQRDADDASQLRRQNLPVQEIDSVDNPFSGTFMPATASQSFYDGDEWQWFRPAYGGSAEGAVEFRDLIGNVAEYVVDDPGEFLSIIQQAPLPADIERQLRSEYDSLTAHVVGGSAISDARLSVTEPWPSRGVRPLMRPYADVGFRLALTLDEEPAPSPMTIVRALRADPPYVLAATQ